MRKTFSLNRGYLQFLLKQDLKMMFVLSLIYFLAMPFNLFTSLDLYDPSYSFLSIEYAVSSHFHIGLVIFILSCILVPCILFGFIMHKQKMDTYQSLPIPRESLFFTHYIETVLVVLLPFLFNWLLSYLVLMIHDLSPFLTNISQPISLIKIILFTPILIGVTLFGFISAGRFFDGLIYAIAMFVSQYFTIFLFNQIFENRLFGMGNVIYNQLNTLFSFTSSLTKWVNELIVTPWTLFWILIGFIFILINAYLYSHRKVEKIEEASVFPWFTFLINTITFTLFTLFLLLTFMFAESYLNSLIIPLLFGLIIYVVVDAIANRGFHKLGTAIPRYFIIGLSCVVVVYSIVYTGFFGLTRNVPQLNEFDTVLLTVNDTSYSNKNLNRNFPNLVHGKETLSDIINVENGVGLFESSVLTTEEDRQMVIDFHESLVEKYYDHINQAGNQPYQYQNSWNHWSGNIYSNYAVFYRVYLTYIHENRVIMRREYNINQQVFEEFYDGVNPID